MDPRHNNFYIELRYMDGYDWNHTRILRDKLKKNGIQFTMKTRNVENQHSYILIFNSQQEWDNAWKIKATYKPTFKTKTLK